MTKHESDSFARNAPAIPGIIGKYKIEGLMTRGGMSLLYLATHPETTEPIIIKVLLPKYLSEDDVVANFLNEARVIALANHPNIVRLIDSGQWQNGLFIAMEFVKGTSLRKILQHQPYALKRSMDVLLQIAYAVSHLHSHGVVHGDLKPENILINEQGQVKVIDFGIAQVLTDKKKELPSRFVGTPIYMSPELGLDRNKFSFQSDIYALGIIAYELALGKISHGRVILSLAPKGLQKILHKALQPKIEDRYQDMCDFVADISAYIKSELFQNDKHGSDYSLVVFEELENLQMAMLTPPAPSWPDIEMGIVCLPGLGLSGQYIDFIELNEGKKAIFIAECDKKGTEGLMYASMLRACLRTVLATLKSANPRLIIQEVIDRITKDLFGFQFSYAFLVIESATSTFELLQKSYGSLVHYSHKEQRYIEISPGTHQLFMPEDQFIFLGSKAKIGLSSLLNEHFLNTTSQAPQSQSDAIVRKARLQLKSDQEELPLCLIVLHILNSYGKKLPPLK